MIRYFCSDLPIANLDTQHLYSLWKETHEWSFVEDLAGRFACGIFGMFRDKANLR